MIIEKHPLPDDPTPTDSPPSYDTLAQLQALTSTGESSTFRLVEKSTDSSSNLTTLVSLPSSAPLSPASKSPKSHNYSRSNPSNSKNKGKGPSNWFNFSSSRNTREVRATVLDLIRGLVRQHQSTSSAETLGILESCAEACASYEICLSSLLQEKFIEGYTPLYWAIIKRPPENPHPDDDATGPDFLTTLLSFSSPLSTATKSEMRLACLVTSDQPLFQRLRLSPEFSPLSGTDEILLGASMPPDEIVVGDVPGDEGAFMVDFVVVQFQQRMRVSKRIGLEFIARGRMWCLSFSIAPDAPKRSGPKPGSWCLTLSLLEHSPPTWIDSRLLIEEPRTPPFPSLPSSDDPSSSNSSLVRNSKPKPKPTICLRLKSGSTQLIAPSDSSRNGGGEVQNEIVVSLDDSMMGAGLQYAGSSYIGSDSTLTARLEARLARPEAECIIC